MWSRFGDISIITLRMKSKSYIHTYIIYSFLICTQFAAIGA